MTNVVWPMLYDQCCMTNVKSSVPPDQCRPPDTSWSGQPCVCQQAYDPQLTNATWTVQMATFKETRCCLTNVVWPMLHNQLQPTTVDWPIPSDQWHRTFFNNDMILNWPIPPELYQWPVFKQFVIKWPMLYDQCCMTNVVWPMSNHQWQPTNVDRPIPADQYNRAFVNKHMILNWPMPPELYQWPVIK